MESMAETPDGHSVFIVPRELHPLAQKYMDVKSQTVLTYSRYFKDMTLFRMLADWYLRGEARVSYEPLVSWDIAKTTDEEKQKHTDRGFYTDMFLLGIPVIYYRLFYSRDARVPGDSYQDVYDSIINSRDLLFLVIPARLPVIFNTIPCYYVGPISLSPFIFRLSLVSGELVLESEYPVPDFSLEAEDSMVLGSPKHLMYDGDLDVGIESDGHAYLYSEAAISVDVQLGMDVVSSPFDDADQMEILKSFTGEDLDRYYRDVVCNELNFVGGQVNNYYVYPPEWEGRRKVIMLDSQNPITEVVIYSGYEGLSDIRLEFFPELMPRYLGVDVPLYSVRIMIDFDLG
jgi:hypothetical protein